MDTSDGAGKTLLKTSHAAFIVIEGYVDYAYDEKGPLS